MPGFKYVYIIYSMDDSVLNQMMIVVRPPLFLFSISYDYLPKYVYDLGSNSYHLALMC